MKEIITVGKLIEMLSTFDKNLPVGIIGHFGEFHELDYDCLNQFEAKVNRSTTYKSWRELSQDDNERVLNISVPDIGEEPN